VAYYVEEKVSTTIGRALDVLRHRSGVVAVYLFGSQAEGTAGPDSDIDFAIFVEGAEGWDMFRRAEFAVAVQREAGDRIEPHVFPASSLDNPEPASFAEYVLEHGMRVDLNDAV
jgi:predicted nucleotidyltransferase